MTLDPNPLLAEFETKRTDLDEFTQRLAVLIRELCKGQNIGVHQYESRTKTSQSLREKLGRPGKRYSGSLSEITDLCGIRITLYTVGDVQRVVNLLRSEFSVDESNSIDKGATLGPSEFGYRSTHLIVALGSPRDLLTEWKRFAEFVAEIQVRTVLQHAWAAIDHALRYKREEDVPREQRRALFRLSALLELADEQFDLLRQQQAAIGSLAEKRVEAGDTDVEIDFLAYLEFEKTSLTLRIIKREAHAAGFRDADFEDDDDRGESISDVVAICSILKLRTTVELEQALLSQIPRLSSYFVELMKRCSVESHVWEFSFPFFTTLVLTLSNAQMDAEALERLGFAQSVANRICGAAAVIRATVK